MKDTCYVGIDVSKAKVDVALLLGSKPVCRTFTNDKKGFKALSSWLVKQSKRDRSSLFVLMEATGIYHERLAHYLHDKGYLVSVINPAHAKQFALAMGNQHKTDKQDSKLLAEYARLTQPDLWQPDSKEVRVLKQLIARLDALEADKQREHNRLEKVASTDSDELVIASIQAAIEFLNQQIKHITDEIDKYIDNNPDLKTNNELLQSIPGIGKKSAPRIMSLLKSKTFDSAAQCAAFVGLIPITKQSGIMKGKSKLSKKGNSKIRAKLYMCALVATKYNPDIQAQYERLQRNGKCKKSALLACARKLLQICFGVLKHQSEYQPQVNKLAA